MSSDRLTPRLTEQAGARNFIRDGFILLEGFLDAPDLAKIQPVVESLIVRGGDSACTRPHNTLLPLRWSDRMVQCFLASERRMDALRSVLGADDLRWISGYISIKEARSPALWWHQDWWCWDHGVSYRRAPAQVATLCYLRDTDKHNGGLRVLPGSHHRSVPIHAVLPEAHGQAADGLEPGHAAMSELPGQVTLCLKAGDAVVIDYRLLHGTYGNRSDARRDCVLLSFAPNWSSLPADIKAHLISHPAQPSENEIPREASRVWELLPRFDGVRRTLPLNRNAPATFEMHD